MKTLLFTCAQGISIDARMASASLFHIIEEVTASVFPSVLPPLTVYGLFQKELNDPDSCSLTLRISLGQDILSENPIIVKFDGKMRAHITGELQGLMVPGTGDLRFKLIDGQKEFCAWTIPVTLPLCAT